MPITIIETQKLKLSLLIPDDNALMQRYLLLNKDYLAPWEPSRAEDFFSREEIDLRIKSALLRFKQRSACQLVILNKAEDEVLGVCNFSNMTHIATQSCHLGYSVGQQHVGQGIMHEALTHAIHYVFQHYPIHRINANYLPHNLRSANVLAKLGFAIEGFAKSYLKINGVWQDHVLTALINPADFSLKQD
jgi:ribosomal-protein-alanine N-acetyltransferase